MSTWPNAYFDCSTSSRWRTSRYVHAGAPLQVEHVVHVLQRHREALEAVGQLDRDRRQVDAAGLLEVGELRDLLAVEQHLPADAPGAERRRLPVVLLEPDVVRAQVDAARLEALQVELLDLVGRRLEDHLELVVLEQPVRVLAEAAVGRPPRRLHVGDVPVAAGPSTRRNVSGCIVPAPISMSSGCCRRQPREAQNSESLKMSCCSVTIRQQMGRPTFASGPAASRAAPGRTSAPSRDAG